MNKKCRKCGHYLSKEENSYHCKGCGTVYQKCEVGMQVPCTTEFSQHKILKLVGGGCTCEGWKLLDLIAQEIDGDRMVNSKKTLTNLRGLVG